VSSLKKGIKRAPRRKKVLRLGTEKQGQSSLKTKEKALYNSEREDSRGSGLFQSAKVYRRGKRDPVTIELRRKGKELKKHPREVLRIEEPKDSSRATKIGAER